MSYNPKCLILSSSRARAPAYMGGTCLLIEQNRVIEWKTMHWESSASGVGMDTVPQVGDIWEQPDLHLMPTSLLVLYSDSRLISRLPEETA